MTTEGKMEARIENESPRICDSVLPFLIHPSLFSIFYSALTISYSVGEGGGERAYFMWPPGMALISEHGSSVNTLSSEMIYNIEV